MNPVRPHFDQGNVEQNINKLTYGNIKANMKINKFDTKSDTVSFLGNCNKPAKGLFEKFIDILNYPIKKSKENKLKKAAEEAAKQARLRASWLKEKEIFEQHIKQTADNLLSEFRAKNNGMFEKKICEDNTGDIVFFSPKATRDYQKYKLPPQKGEYTLENFGTCQEYSDSYGAHYMTLKKNGEYLDFFKNNNCYQDVQPTFADNRWHMHYSWSDGEGTLVDRLPDSYRLPRKITCLSCGYEGSNISRHPGAVFTIEGHIPLNDMKNIKKNLVEKGIWEHYIKVMKSNPTKEEEQEARLAVYNEILKYLNK